MYFSPSLVLSVVFQGVREKISAARSGQPAPSDVLSQSDLLSAVKSVQRSVGTADLDRLQQWMDEYGSV